MNTIQTADTPVGQPVQIVFPSTLTEEERLMNEDYEWCLTDPAVRKAYGGKVVVAYQRKIWGAGTRHDHAWSDALKQPGFPASERLVYVVVPDDFSS